MILGCANPCIVVNCGLVIMEMAPKYMIKSDLINL